MIRVLNFCLLLSVVLFTACSDLDNGDVETILTEAKAYPLTLEHRMFCNIESTAQEVMDKNLVKDGLVTAQLKHTPADFGKPLIYFTDKAAPYLIATDDTLKSFDIQRIKVADEVFLRVSQIEINPAGNKAVVDYYTEIINPTPFIILYKQDIKGEQRRRTFFTRKDKRWTWDGKIIKML